MKYPRIRNLREDNDLTQQQIADMLYINRRTYAAYENGINSMTPETLQITAETHRILLNRLVADFGDKLVENGVLTVENVQHKVVFI